MTDIIVKSIDLVSMTYKDEYNITKVIQAETGYLVPKRDGTTEHDRYVTDENNIISKQSTGSKVEPVDTSGLANKNASNLDSSDTVLWRLNLDLYNESEVNNKFANGSNESITRLGQPVLGAGNIVTLSFINENNIEQKVTLDLSGLVTVDVKIDDASYDAANNILNLTNSNGVEFNIDFSEFSVITTTDQNGVTTLTQEAVSKLTVSKVGQSGQYADLLGKPDVPVPVDISGKLDKPLPPYNTSSRVVLADGNTKELLEIGVWTEQSSYEEYAGTIIKKITGYTGGTGVLPVELSNNINKYYAKVGGFTTVKTDATDFKSPIASSTNFPDFTDKIWTVGSMVFDANKVLWKANVTTAIGDIPGVSTKWTKYSGGGISDEDLTKLVTKNFYSPAQNITGKYVKTDGTLSTAANSIYAKIPVPENTNLTIKKSSSASVFDGIASINEAGTILYVATYNSLPLDISGTGRKYVTPVGAKYILMTIYTDVTVTLPNISANLQIEQGNTATAYEPYKQNITALKGFDLQDTKARLGNITDWQEQGYKAGQFVFNTGSIYKALVDTLGSQIPGIAPNTIWRLENYSSLLATNLDKKVVNNIYSTTQNITGKFVKSTGTLSDAANSVYAKVPIEPNTNYVISKGGNSANSFQQVLFLNVAGTVLSNASIGAMPLGALNIGRLFTSPADAAFMLLNIFSDVTTPGYTDISTTLQIEKGIVATPYALYEQRIPSILGLKVWDLNAKERLDTIDFEKNLRGKNAAILGDSITTLSNVNWSIFIDLFNQRTNVARSGAKWAHSSNTVYDITLNGDNCNVMWNQANKIISMYNAGTILKPDVFIIKAGRNDANAAWGNVANAFTGDILSRNTNTILTAVEAIRYTCETILTAFPYIQIILVTPIQWAEVTNTNYKIAGDFIKQCANILSVEVIDAGGESGITTLFDTATVHKYLYDGTHPNSTGSAKLGSYMRKKLQQKVILWNNQ